MCITRGDNFTNEINMKLTQIFGFGGLMDSLSDRVVFMFNFYYEIDPIKT